MYVGERTLLAKTCIGCHKLKDAVHFKLHTFRNGIYRRTLCRQCQNQDTARRLQEKNQATLLTATQHRQPWTLADLSRLEALHNDGLTHRQIAEKMGRSQSAVSNAISRRINR